MARCRPGPEVGAAPCLRHRRVRLPSADLWPYARPMPRPRLSHPPETGRVTMADLNRQTPRQRLRKARKPVMVATGAACVVAGLVAQQAAAVVYPPLIGLGWWAYVFFTDEARVRTSKPANGPYPLPDLLLVYRDEPAEAHPAPMFVDARRAGAGRHRWFSGGGVGLSRDGLVTAADGRGLVQAWPTRTGGVVPGALNTSRMHTSLLDAATTGPIHVVEMAVVGDGTLVHGVFLRNERGEQLAALPAAGLDGRRLAALARAAGIHYRRYHADLVAGPFSLAFAEDCFPLAASFSRFEGPVTPVSEEVWTLGEADAARA